MNISEEVDCISEDNQPHEYFLASIWGRALILGALIAETNLLERKIISKGRLRSYFRFHKWEPETRQELLAFLG